MMPGAGGVSQSGLFNLQKAANQFTGFVQRVYLTDINSTTTNIKLQVSGLPDNIFKESFVEIVNSGANLFGIVKSSDGDSLTLESALSTAPSAGLFALIYRFNNFIETDNMMIGSGSVFGTVTVGTTATAIRVSASDLDFRHNVVIQNTSANDIFVGFDNTVTTSDGFKIAVDNFAEFTLNPFDPITLFGIASANSEVRVMELKNRV